MLNDIFQGIFDSSFETVIAPRDFLLCVLVSLIIGVFLAYCYTCYSQYTQGFVASIALLPAIVCVVIMMVNGNVGTGVAVAGSFSLVRFRSAAGSAKEISAVFLAMATGLMTGTGYLAYAVLAALILGGISVFLGKIKVGKRRNGLNKTMHITIPEDLDYTDVFDPIIEEYTTDYEMTQVKTTNMGSLFRLTYDLTLKDLEKEKEMIDKLRTRNGNLEISISKQATTVNEL